MTKSASNPGLNGDRRVVFFGAERVGLACLQTLVSTGHDVVGVVTAHDDLKPSIADWAAFDDYTEEQGLELFKVKSCQGAKVLADVLALAPALVCIVSWSMIIPAAILAVPPRGTVGIHYAMLPARRGGAPLNWAIIDGLEESGLTLYYMDDGIDTGDIIDQVSFEITDTDTVKDLLDKVVDLAPALLSDNIDALLEGTAPRAQQDESLASYTPRRRPEDGEIDWSKSDRELYNLIRAVAPPYPCAFTDAGNRKLVFPSATLVDGRLHVEAHLE